MTSRLQSLDHAAGFRIRASLLVSGLAVGLFTAAATRAATFTVSATTDAGLGSLRQAILDANAVQSPGNCPTHRIVFSIPGAGPHRIRPLSALPALQVPIDLDGYTQPGSSPNSAFNGIDAVLRIEIDGSLAGAADGITVGYGGVGVCGGTGSLIRGLAVNRFSGSGVVVGVPVCPVPPCTVGAVSIQGNFIGTDITGSIALGNGSAVAPAILIGVQSGNNVVGERTLSGGGGTTPNPALRNLISGNDGDAIGFAATTASALSALNSIRNNYIGLDASGAALLPNGGDGVVARDYVSDLYVEDNLIGGNVGDGIDAGGSGVRATLARNGIGVGVGGVAAGNGGDGVRVSGGAIVTVAGAYPGLFPPAPSIGNNAGAGVYVEGPSYADVIAAQLHGNAGLGIDLAPRGVNGNDPLDGDAGPNHLLNVPLIDEITTDTAAQTTHFSGRLQTEPNTQIELTFYAGPACNPSGAGEGLRRLTNRLGGLLLMPITTDSVGEATFAFTTTFDQALPVPVGQVVTAVARRFAPDVVGVIEVSEFSNCVTVSAAGYLFADGFEP